MGATSEHFSEAELACHGTTCGSGHGCHVNGCQPELLTALEEFRALVGKPVHIDDAYRCPVHNAEVHGAAHSQHLQGIAADISVEGMTPAELEAVARQVPIIHGIGRADHADYLHVDVRSVPAQWCYDISGESIPYFPPRPESV